MMSRNEECAMSYATIHPDPLHRLAIRTRYCHIQRVAMCVIYMYMS